MSRSHNPDGPAIDVRGVSKRYGRTLALAPFDLTVERGEFLVLVGASGSGKSTLLNMLGALERPDTGEICVSGHRLGRRARHLNHFRREEVGIVFQLHNLIPRLTARENIQAAMLGVARRHERVARSNELLAALRLSDRADERPPTMSGGERQRVAIARALANEPKVILADEATGSLDDEAAAVVIDIFRDWCLRGGTVLAVTHDPRLMDAGDRQVSMPAPESRAVG